MNIDSDIEEMTNDLSVRVPTIMENVQAFLLAVPEKYPNPTIPIRRELFEKCLVKSEANLLLFLSKNKIGFLDEDNFDSDVLWRWRQALNKTTQDPTEVITHIIAAKEFLKHFKQLLSPQLLQDLDIVPNPGKKDGDKKDYVERNPLFVYIQDLL
jgi:hypothetical protein